MRLHLPRMDLGENKKGLRAAAACDVAAATSRGLVPDGPDAGDSDDAAIATDKVLDENGTEAGILEKGTKRYWHPLDDEDSDETAQHSIVIEGNKLKRERERERETRERCEMEPMTETSKQEINTRVIWKWDRER